MAYTEKEYRRLLAIYTQVLQETLNNEKLSSNLIDVEKAIEKLEEIILSERSKGPTPALDEIKNDLYYLKFEILERL